MKRVLLIPALLVAMNLFAQAPVKGKVRIYLHSVHCEKETVDDLFDGDGKGDEFFITVFYSVASSNGTTKYINKVSTGVYGDNKNRPDRVKRGTAGPDGGMKPGDVAAIHPQSEAYMPIGDERFKGLKVIDVDLEAGDILTVLPVIWEWDGPQGNTQNAFESYIWNSFNNINVRMATYTQQFDIKTARRRWSDDARNSINMAGLTQILQGVNGKPGTRPIGMAENGSYDPEIYVFNSVILENWKTLTEPYSNFYAYNVYYRYDEPRLGNNRDHGKYMLMFYPEFFKPAPPPPPANANNNPVSGGPSMIKNPGDKPLSIKNPGAQTSAMTAKQIFPGNWSGTQTSASGLYPQNYAFELTATNEFIMKVQSTGAIACRGTYTTSGLSISGSYKQFSSSETFSFTGAYDASTGQMTCTLGTGSSTTNQGKWVVTKNPN
jgi:hypothetical protein